MSDYLSLTQGPMQHIEELLFETLQGSKEEEHVNAMCMHVVRAGGKRMRPRLTMLCGMALPSCDFEKLHDLERMAAAVELLHTASLIHDDVIDKASVRRGQPTLNETDGNHAAVLAGDYMFTRCFTMMYGLNCMPLYEAMAQTVSHLVTGELNQLRHQGDLTVSVDYYYHTIFCKTGALFELACSGPAILKHEDEKTVEALRTYGKMLGRGFQIADDLLDYTSNTGTIGKDTGEDLSDGRITLPLILTLSEASSEDRAALESAIHAGDFEQVCSYIGRYDGIAKAQALADEAADQAIAALEALPASDYRDALAQIARLAVKRNS